MSVIRTRRPSLRHLPVAVAAAGLMTTVALAGPAAAWNDAHGPQAGYFQACLLYTSPSPRDRG